MAADVSGPTDGAPPAFPGNAPPAPPAFPGNAPPAPPPPAPPLFPPPQGQFPPPSGYDTATGSGYASWGLRLGGWLIDTVIFAVVQGVVAAILPKRGALVVHYTMSMHNGTTRHNHISFLAIIITVILAIIYATVLVGGRRGQTVGMMAVGVRCVTDAGGAQIGMGKAFGRALLEEVLRVTVIIWILDMLWPLWDKKRQTLHDKAVGSVVIRSRNAG